MSLLDELTPDERAQAEAAVARARAEMVDTAPLPPEGRFVVDGGPTGPSVLDQLLADQDVRDGEDFTAFWTGRKRKGATLRNVVPGVDLGLPAELPLAFEVEARRLAHDESLAAVHHLFAMLYGAGTLDQLITGGLTGEQLGVLILWGAANGSGRTMSLTEAAVEFERMKAKKAATEAGKAAPLPGSGVTSAGTGAASKPTSPASTTSPNPTSPA